MTGIFAARAPSGRPRCARCNKHFTPRKEGDRYGPTCARKAAKDHLEALNTKGEVVAVIV